MSQRVTDRGTEWVTQWRTAGIARVAIRQGQRLAVLDSLTEWHLLELLSPLKISTEVSNGNCQLFQWISLITSKDSTNFANSSPWIKSATYHLWSWFGLSELTLRTYLPAQSLEFPWQLSGVVMLCLSERKPCPALSLASHVLMNAKTGSVWSDSALWESRGHFAKKSAISYLLVRQIFRQTWLLHVAASHHAMPHLLHP